MEVVSSRLVEVVMVLMVVDKATSELPGGNFSSGGVGNRRDRDSWSALRRWSAAESILEYQLGMVEPIIEALLGLYEAHIFRGH